MNVELDEDVLPDDYPMYPGYAYVVDGKPISNPYDKLSVAAFKQRTKALEVRRCDIFGRRRLEKEGRKS